MLLSFDGFTQTDITSVSWTIYSSTHDVTALDLEALQSQADCGPGLGTDCSNSTLSLTAFDLGEGGTSCSFDGVFSRCEELRGQSTVSYVPTVPEPSTWAMMLLGFAGLGFAGYVRREGP